MNNLKCRTLNFTLFSCFLLVTSFSSYGQQVGFYKTVNEEYIKKKYETAYDEFLKLDKKIVYQGKGNKTDDRIKDYLDWGIRLSFLTKEWSKLDQFIAEYNELEPNFSIKVLTDNESDQLKKYIENYLKDQKGNLVYVNKHPQDIDLAPATITVYTKDDIERLGARDLLDLIRLTAGFAELGDNNERIFGTRGSSNTTLQDVLFLINGHRITDVLTNTNAPDWISLDYVEQIELVKGPGSALYGGSAFSGVVNIITKDGTDLKSQVSVHIGNGNSLTSTNSLTTRINYQTSQKVNNNGYLYFSASFKQSDGNEINLANTKYNTALPDILSAGDTLRQADSTGVEFVNEYGPSYNILARYTSKRLNITANLQSSVFVDARPISFNIWDPASDSLSKFRGRVDNRQFLQFEYDLPVKNLSLKLSGDHFGKKLYLNSFSTGIEESSRLIGDEYRGTINLEYVKSSPKSNSKKSLVIAGFEAFVNNWFYNYFEDRNGVYELEKVGDHFIDSTDNNRNEYVAALYLQAEQHLISDKLVATLGVRFNYHNEFSRFDTFVWGQAYSPRLALVYLPEHKGDLNPVKLKLIYNSAFLPPPFLYRRGGIRFFEANENLRSQNIESGEFIVFGDLNKNFSYSALTYRNKIDQNIRRGENSTFVNDSTEIRVSGYELELKFRKDLKIADVSVFANYSTTRQNFARDSARNTYFKVFNNNVFSTRDSLTLFPRSQLKAGINFRFKPSNKQWDDLTSSQGVSGLKKPEISIGANAQLIGRSIVNNSFEFDTNGDVIASANTSQEISPELVLNALVKVHFKNATIGCSIYNLLDKEYFLPSAISRLNRQFAEGRTIFLDFTYHFQ